MSKEDKLALLLTMAMGAVVLIIIGYLMQRDEEPRMPVIEVTITDELCPGHNTMTQEEAVAWLAAQPTPGPHAPPLPPPEALMYLPCGIDNYGSNHDVDKIVWHNAKTHRIVVGRFGTWGTPMSFLEPPREKPLASDCNTTYLERWFADCGTPPLRYWVWIAPPPLTKCRQDTEPIEQYGYICLEGKDGIAGFQGAWRPLRRGY